MIRKTHLNIFSGLFTTMLAASAFGDAINLKPAIRLAPDAQIITLGDLAELEGDLARALAQVEVARVNSSDSVMELSVREIRQKLDDAGVHWGHVSLNGRSVIVRPGRSTGAAPPLAMTSVSLDEPATIEAPAPRRSERSAAELMHAPTVRGTIANLIISNLRLDPHDLRLSFDVKDDDLLETQLNSTRFEVQPLSSFASDRIELRIRTWSAGRVQESRTVSVLPMMRVMASELRFDVDRNHQITEHDVIDSEQWFPPSRAAQTLGRVAAIGRVASRPLKAGDVLRDVHVRRQTLVKRGDVVVVRCLVGGAVISLQAEARDDAGEGDQIEFRKLGERETFLATVAARGEAVMNLNR